MATKAKEELKEQFTMEAPEEEPKYSGPTVEVFIPELENHGNDGLKVDQYEHVTIANEEKHETYYVRRGERVEVPVPVFLALKERYPKI